MRTLLNRIIIKQDEAQNTLGSFVLSDTAKERPRQGEVKIIGPKTESAKVGDKVIYGEFAGTKINVGEDELIVLREDDLLVIL